MNAHEKERNEMLSKIDEEKIKALQEQPVKIDIRKELESIEFMGVNDARDSETIARHFYELGRQSKEQPLCEDFDLESDRFFRKLPLRVNTPPIPDEYIDEETFDRIARHFAKWGREQMMDEWLKDRDGCFWDGVEEGKKAMREQMMKETVEGEVVTTNKYTSVRYLSRYGTFRYFYGIGGGFQKGDKVKLIIAKED